MPINLYDYLRAAGNFSLIRSPSDLADDVVEEDAIDDGAVTESKIGAEAVTEAKLGSGAVTEGKIGAGAVSNAKLDTPTRSAISKATALPTVGTPAQGNMYYRTNAAGNTILGPPPDGATISRSAPQDVAETAVAGGSGEASDAGHVHEISPDLVLSTRNLPETTRIVSAALRRGGNRLLSDGSIQIAGDLQGSALGTIDTNADWTDEVVRTQGTSAGANPWIQARFRIAEYPALPAPSALDDVFFSPVDSGDPDDPAPLGTVMTIVSRSAPSDDTSNTYHYAYVQIGIANWPEGEYVRLLRTQPTELDVDIQPSDILPGTNDQVLKTVGGVTTWAAESAGSGGGGEPDWTTLLDYNPTSLPQLTSRTLWECPISIVPALTSEEDEHLLLVEIMLSEGSTDINTREVWSISELVRAGDYRTGGNTPASSNVDAVVWGFTDGAVSADTTLDRWTRLVVCKGPNGRIAMIPLGRGAYVQRIRIRLVEFSGGGSDGMSGMQLTQSQGNELRDYTVGRRNLTLPLLAELSPTVRVRFASGLGEVLYVFGSPAQGDSLNNNDPASSYRPLDVSPQIPPHVYDNSGNTLPAGRLGYFLSFGGDTVRQADPRYGRGGVVNNELRMPQPTLQNEESFFLFGEFVHYGTGAQPIFSIWTNETGMTSWTMWSNATTGRLHIAEADGTEYGNITPAGGAGLRGRLIRYGFQVDKTATGYQLAWQVNGVDVAMSNPSTNPTLPRISFGWFPTTQSRFDGQMPIVSAIRARNAALGIPAGATGFAETSLINPFGIPQWQYSVDLDGDFEYGRAWSENLLDTPATIVNTNRPYITFNRSFDLNEMDELRLEVQLYATERAYVHQYLRELATSTLAVPNTAYVDAAAFEWESGKSPTQWFRGQLSNRSAAQYGTNIYPVVNGTVCTGLQFRNHSNGGDSLIVRGVWVR